MRNCKYIKAFIFITAALCLLGGIYSCEDSLGYDEYVEKTLLQDDTSHADEPIEPVDDYNSRLKYYYSYEIFENPDPTKESWKNKIEDIEIIFDTIETRTFVSFKLTCVEDLSEDDKNSRSDWVQRISFWVTGFLDEEIFYLSSLPGERRSAEIEIYSKRYERSFVFHSYMFEMPPQVTVFRHIWQWDIYRHKWYLENMMKITIEIPGKNHAFETKRFTANYYTHLYKK